MRVLEDTHKDAQGQRSFLASVHTVMESSLESRPPLLFQLHHKLPGTIEDQNMSQQHIDKNKFVQNKKESIGQQGYC